MGTIPRAPRCRPNYVVSVQAPPGLKSCCYGGGNKRLGDLISFTRGGEGPNGPPGFKNLESRELFKKIDDIGPRKALFSEGPLKLASQGPSWGPRGSLEALVEFLNDQESV